MRINKNTYNTFIAFLIGLYFMFTSLDYLLKISSGASYLRVAGISIYVFALLGIVIFGGFKANKYHIYLFYFMIFPFISVLWATYYKTALTKSFTIATTILVVFFTMDLELTDRQIRIIELLAIVGAMIAGIYSIQNQGLQRFLTGGRIYLSGDMDTSDPNGMAARLFLPLILAFKWFTQTEKKIWKTIWLLIFLFILLLFLMCGSRGAMIGLIVSILILVIRKAKKDMTKSMGILLFILAVFILLILCADKILPPYIYNRLFIASSYTGTSSRVVLWQYFFRNSYFKSPIIGFGCFGPYYEIGGVVGRQYYSLHNAYISMIGEYGVFYLPVFLVFLFSIWKRISLYDLNQCTLPFIGICVIICFLDGYETKYFWNMILYCLLSINCYESSHNVKVNVNYRGIKDGKRRDQTKIDKWCNMETS